MSDVICPNCSESWLETTNTFNPYKTINAAMFRLKKQYRDEGQGFCGVHSDSITDSIEGHAVQYPCCGAFMCDGNFKFVGRIEGEVSNIGTDRIEKSVKKPRKKPKKKCVCECGKEFDYPIALFNHQKKCDYSAR